MALLLRQIWVKIAIWQQFSLLTLEDTTTGNSTSAVSATTAVTSGFAFRIVDFVDAPGSTIGDAYTDLLVKFNPDSHSYTNKTGI